VIPMTVNRVPILLCDVYYYYLEYSIFKNTLRCGCDGGDDERALLLISTTAAQRQFETLVKRANGSAFVSGVMTVYIIYMYKNVHTHTHTHTHYKGIHCTSRERVRKIIIGARRNINIYYNLQYVI